jgi:hypothetical protein
MLADENSWLGELWLSHRHSCRCVDEKTIACGGSSGGALWDCGDRPAMRLAFFLPRCASVVGMSKLHCELAWQGVNRLRRVGRWRFREEHAKSDQMVDFRFRSRNGGKAAQKSSVVPAAKKIGW